MTSLYLRIAMYLLIAAGLVWGGAHYESAVWNAKYTALVAADASASLKAEQIAAENAARISAIYADKLSTTETTYETQITTGRTAADRLAASLRNYKNRCGVNTVPPGSAAPGKPNAAGTSDSSDSTVADATRQLIEAAAAAAAELTGLQAERASIMLQNVTVTATKVK
jgi:hypothetical protein